MDEKSQSDSRNNADQDISHLKRREIQAPLAANLIRAFSSVLGVDRAREIAVAAIQADAEAAGVKTAEDKGVNTLHEFRQYICATWAQNDAIVIRDIEETDSRLSFHVVRCRYAELYDEMAISDLGYCLSCCRDEPFARGFNPRIQMTRTRTIMQGAPCCDFLFTLEKR